MSPPKPSSKSSLLIPYAFLLLLLLLTRATTRGATTRGATRRVKASTDALLVLEKVKPALQGGGTQNPVLSSWNESRPLCEWHGLKFKYQNGSGAECEAMCSQAGVLLSSIRLPSANLSGSLPNSLSDFPALDSVFLNFNSLTMHLPLDLGFSSSLHYLDFSNNLLSGPLPPSIWNLCDRLVFLSLHSNSLSGPLSFPFPFPTSCPSLQVLDLAHNFFSGPFPVFLTSFLNLTLLDLSTNSFSGLISPDILALNNLHVLNLSYNNFTGLLPPGMTKFGPEAFVGNSPALCGGPLGACVGPGSMTPGAIAGLVIGLMTALVVAVSLLIGYLQNKRRRRGRRRGDDEEEEDLDDCEEDGEGSAVQNGEAKLIVFQGGEHLTLEDVLNATGQVIEKTSYGTSYKAKLADGATIALRLLREGCCKDRSSCLPVVRPLGRLRHENLDPLRAFYQGKRGEKLLIYDYVPTRTLYELLHETKLGKPVLNWTRRHKIALGIARGLSYLHTGLETTMTHGNVKSKNVLVDDFFVARLTEIGVDRLVIPEVADEMLSQLKAEGYRAPELQRMNKSNPRTDVYAFGIMLLEILIGKKPDKNSRSGDFLDLPSMVKTAVLEETTMEVFDVEVLKGIRSPMEDGLVHALKLAMGCCAPVASARPTMDEVVKQLEENRPRNRSALYSPTETRSGTGTPF
ncbi:hypothetical protein vseg_003894 [Gypsophila vaccaria]